MKYTGLFLTGLILGVILSLGWQKFSAPQKFVIEQKKPEPLWQYSINNLGDKSFKPGYFELISKTEASDDYTAYTFLFDSEGKKVSGLAYLPAGKQSCLQSKCPVIIQIRGYAEKEVYKPGYGTYRSSRELAKAGFITLAPDFLGYGESASPSADVFEARFETYTTVLSLIADAGEVVPFADANRIGLWGHSNGGHIALTILEITGKDYPTVLWAPVSAGFPYSILFYMDENGEGDRELRKKLADFEEIYDASRFNLINYLGRIKAPIQLHQGTADKSVPVDWSRNLATKLKNLGREVNYFEYSGADHNLSPDWNTVVERDIVFFSEKLGLTK